MSAAASRARARRSGKVYLTFDDGPDPAWTPAVLDELAALGVHATFFVIAERALRHPELVRRALAEGHEVELHCMRHRLHSKLSREEVEADLREGLAALREIGCAPRRWRAPGGVVTQATLDVAAAHGVELVGWSADPYDWRGEPVAHMRARLATELEGGSVVLLHDGLGPGALRSECEDTVALLEPLSRQIRALGCDPAALGEGPAFWWANGRPAGGRSPGELLRLAGPVARRLLTTRPRGPKLAYAVETAEEVGLSEADLRMVRGLLAAQIPTHADEYAERGWRRLRPEFRTLARADGKVIGQESAFAIDTEPGRRLYGLGDAVVRRDRRGHGIARALTERAVAECWSRGAEILLTDSFALRGVFVGLGFAPVPRFAFYYEREGRCRWHPGWLAAVRVPVPRPRLRLAEGDY